MIWQENKKWFSWQTTYNETSSLKMIRLRLGLFLFFAISSSLGQNQGLIDENRSSSRHVFTNFANTNLRFFSIYQILCNICSDLLKTEKKMPFLTDKEFAFFFNWETLVKKFVDSYSENSWKHVVNSKIVWIWLWEMSFNILSLDRTAYLPIKLDMYV